MKKGKSLFVVELDGARNYTEAGSRKSPGLEGISNSGTTHRHGPGNPWVSEASISLIGAEISVPPSRRHQRAAPPGKALR